MRRGKTRRSKLEPLVRGTPIEITTDRRGATIKLGHPVTIEERFGSSRVSGAMLPEMDGTVLDMYTDEKDRGVVLVKASGGRGTYSALLKHVVYRWNSNDDEIDATLVAAKKDAKE